MRPVALPHPDVLKAANINPHTGLATDYLNHYNEIAMMIATLGDMPELREPVLAWQPVGYATHFRMTGFRDRELAVEAYEHVPADVKARFFEARRQVELVSLDVQDLIEAAPEASAQLAARAPEIFAAIARLGGIINGGQSPARSAQADIDSLFE